MLDKQINLQIKTGNLLNWFLQPKSRCLSAEPSFVKQSMSDAIYAAYDSLNPDCIDTSRIDYSIDKIDESRYESDFLRPVLEMSDLARKNVYDLIDDFILHGSLATFDFKPGWSDFDAMVIIKDETLASPSKMTKLRDVFFEIDDLIKKIDRHQHHGIHFVTGKDMMMYPDLYLPSNLLMNSLSLHAGGKLSIFVRDSRDEQISRFNSIYETFKNANNSGVLEHHAYDGTYLLDNFRNYKNGMYQLKYFLSVIVILPSYFMNILGHSLTKPRSIVACRPLIDEETFKIIDKASAIRNSWSSWPVINNEISEDTMSLLGENYFLDGYNLIKEMKSCLGV